MAFSEQQLHENNNSPIVQLSDVGLRFGEKTILNGVNLELYPNEIVAILGPSGSGKSTMIKIISGLLTPNEGEVSIQSERIALAFQYGALFTSLSVFDNIAMVIKEVLGIRDKREIKDRVMTELERVGLEEDSYKLPNELSGGMQKRVGIARALAIEPDIMLYDEPSAGLDPIIAHQLEVDLREINETLKMGTLLVTHEMDSVRVMADRVLILYQGQFVFSGSVDAFFNSDDPYATQFRERHLDGPIEL